MKKYIFLFLLFLGLGSSLYGEFIPLQQYNKNSTGSVQIPNNYLLGTYGILTALHFQCEDIEKLIKNFNELLIGEQYHVAYVLSALQKDKRIEKHFIPAYNAVRRRKNEKSFNDTFGEKSKVLWKIFIISLENDFSKAADFYEYARKTALDVDSKKTEDEQLYIVSMFTLASHKKLIHATDFDRNKIIEDIINVINKLTSNRAKTILSYNFIHFFTPEQVINLNTTEYALLFSIPKILYYGKFIDFFPIYMNIIQHTDLKFLENMQILDELNFYFPTHNWTTLTDAINFIKHNIQNLHFDPKNKKYIKLES